MPRAPKKVKVNDPISARDYNILVQAVLDLQKLGLHKFDFKYKALTWFWGILDAEGQAAYSDERYWVKRAYINLGTGDSTTRLRAAATYNIVISTGSNANQITVTNLTEYRAGSHRLKAGTPVQVWELRDVQISPGIHYIISQAPSTSIFNAKITGNSEVAAGTNQWVYAWSEVHKTTVGYLPAHWTTFTGGRSGTTGTLPARNRIEVINTGVAAHVEGNGVNMDHLDPADTGADTFSLMPCTTNNIVSMEEINVGGTLEYWFSYENGVDGACE